MYEHATNHVVFGAPSPIFGITLQSKSLDGGRKTGLADNSFPSTRGRLDDGWHVIGEVMAPSHCTEIVPNTKFVPPRLKKASAQSR